MKKSSKKPNEPSASPPDDAVAKPPPRSISSKDLFQGAQEVLIEHGGETYRLRVTRSGKLILHK